MRVNHIKMIKGQMFGRAGLALPRKRVLLTAQNRHQDRNHHEIGARSPLLPRP